MTPPSRPPRPHLSSCSRSSGMCAVRSSRRGSMSATGASTQEATWTVPSYSRVLALVKNPVYAGAFVYGRTETRTRVVHGRGRKTAGHAVPMQEWDVLIRDHHEGYISWEDYVRHQEILENNARMEGRMSNGATRKGAALLAGLLRCRRCGRKLHVAYSGPRSSTVRYWCRGANINHGSTPCISFAGRRTDAAVVELVAQVLAPAGVEAALVARELRASEEDEKRKSLCLGLERARYEADRARRQYDAVEPENRLVAAELEARWDSALERASGLEKELADHMAAVEPVPEWEQQRLLQLGSDLQRAFEQQSATPQAKKRILRAVIEEIVADVGEEPPEVHLTIHWAGGVHTRLGVKKNRTGHHRFCTDRDVADLVRELAAICPDEQIARHLNRLGHRTGKGNSWNRSRVCSLRASRRIPAFDPETRTSWLSLSEAADRLGVSQATVRRFIVKGVLPAKQAAPGTPWIV
ncbi:MAG: serine recombinase, partial [Candidatus Eisenbacteria bacterium]|nr:serine recombinase [Candidatus Eisenbacteria bacterium]